MARRKKIMKGAGVIDNLKSALSSANKFLKEKKVISRIGKAIGESGIPYVSAPASAVGKIAEESGYGRKKMMKGAGRKSAPIMRF